MLPKSLIPPPITHVLLEAAVGFVQSITQSVNK